MALAVVQKTSKTASASSVATDAIATTTGNLVHVTVHIYTGGSGFLSIADTAGNTFTSVGLTPTNTGGCAVQVYYVKNATGHASNVYTVTLSGSGIVTVGVIEISGAHLTAPLDLAGTTGTANTTTPSFTTAGTTAQANEIIVGGIGDSSGNAVSESSGFTSQNDKYSGGIVTMHDATKIVSATGTQTYAPTMTNSNTFSMWIVSYKEAAAAAGRASRMSLLGAA